jgi:crossover junction endodeoxyribonuclease RuvC
VSIIIGVDPGLNNTGWGIVEFHGGSNTYIDSGIIKTNSKQEFAQRLKLIHASINEVLEKYNPEFVVIEKIFINTNAKSSLDFAYTRGSIILTLALNNLKIQELSPNSVKKRITGNGHASKEQIRYMVQNILKIQSDYNNFDTYDALALAMCFERDYSLCQKVE